MNHISEIFGSMVFNDKVMHERLPKDIYKTLKKTILEGRQLDAAVASVVAFAVSMAAIKFLMDFVKKHSFEAFGWYRIVLGAVVIIFYIFR